MLNKRSIWGWKQTDENENVDGSNSEHQEIGQSII